MPAAIALAPSLPGLIVADRARPMTELLDPQAPGVEVCYDSRGELLAYCRAEGGSLRVDLPDLASFSFDCGARDVSAVTHRPLSTAFIRDTYHHCVLPLMLPALGTEVLHASAVRGAAGVAVLCGESGTGKSTMARALARRGYTVWADDAVAMETDGPRPMAIPLPFAARLGPDTGRFLDAAGERKAALLEPPADGRPVPLAMLCMLRRVTEGAAVAVERLEAARACEAALAHAYCFSVRDAAQKRRTVGSYLALAAQVPSYEMRFRPGIEHFPAVLDAVEALSARPR